MTFRVGQKVVCVDEGAAGVDPRLLPGAGWVRHWPVRGSVYTVRFISDRGGVRLVEIVNPIVQFAEGMSEASFKGYRFRPIVERKTDISIFTAMLKPDYIGAPV